MISWIDVLSCLLMDDTACVAPPAVMSADTLSG